MSTRQPDQRLVAAPDTNGRIRLHFDAGPVPTVRHLRQVLTCLRPTFTIGGNCGGGFGGRWDTITEPSAILGSGVLTGRPVRYILGREERCGLGRPAARANLQSRMA